MYTISCVHELLSPQSLLNSLISKAWRHSFFVVRIHCRGICILYVDVLSFFHNFDISPYYHLFVISRNLSSIISPYNITCSLIQEKFLHVKGGKIHCICSVFLLQWIIALFCTKVGETKSQWGQQSTTQLPTGLAEVEGAWSSGHHGDKPKP